MHQHHVEGNSIDPGTQTGLPAKPVQAPKYLQKDFLNDVLQIDRAEQGTAPEHASCQTRNVLTMAHEKHVESLVLSLEKAFDENFVVEFS